MGVIYDETNAVAIMDQQYTACEHANGQFCRINAQFQTLMNPPSCITALYAKNDQAIRGTVFPVNILYATYLHSCCSYFEPLGHSLKP